MLPALIWLIVGLGLLIIELFTMTFFLMWIAVAALLAALTALFTASMWFPWAVFSVAAIILLLVTRPLARSLHGAVTVPSNVDSLIGQQAYVLQVIDPRANTGRVRVKSDEWRARSTEVIPEGVYVTVLAVEGATLMVASIAAATAEQT